MVIKIFEKCCLLGLWCGKKREILEDGIVIDENYFGLFVKIFEKCCLFGLWCGKKWGYFEELLV